jgi:O2-independent ubiquinone biosynthesis accessory factor UbiT
MRWPSDRVRPDVQRERFTAALKVSPMQQPERPLRPRSEASPASPLSLVLLAGLALRPVPLPMFQPLLRLAAGAVARRHPALLARLDGFEDARFLIDPVDLPIAFLLRLSGRHLELSAVGKDAGAQGATAVVRGALLILLDMLEGRIDGDAVFFTRELTIEGDTAAVVALRNAIENAEIDLADDMAALLGPLQGLGRAGFGAVTGLLRAAARDLETLRAALLAPLERQARRQAREVAELKAGLAALKGEKRKYLAAHATGGESS